MSNDSVVSVEQEIDQVFIGKPHVVLLGAGASRAALPDGDVNGRLLPVMEDFLDVVPVRDHFTQGRVQVNENDFEQTYSSIAEDPKHSDLTSEIDKEVYDYFKSLELPPIPTLYDHLLLALREKDVIATFNWDPFLLQAAKRCMLLNGKLPTLLFLHGNVLSGFCSTDSVQGYSGYCCSQCGRPFEPSRLLYPIAQKDYRSDPMIATAWNHLEQSLKNAFMVTVFGYSAPSSDKSAVDILKGAWGPNIQQNMEQFEIIDIRESDELRRSWDPFIHTHHCEIHRDFYESLDC